MSAMKRCTLCPPEQALQPIENFFKDSKRKDGHRSECKACRKSYVKQYMQQPSVKQKVKERLKTYHRQWYQRNKERKDLRSKQWHEQNREKANAYVRKWNAKNPEYYRKHYEKNKDKILVYAKRWYQANKEHRNLLSNQHYENNKKHVSDMLKRRRKEHPETFQLKDSKRRALKQSTTIEPITKIQWQYIKMFYNHRCAYCGNKPRQLTMDHIIPLAKEGTHTLSNIIPACKGCNLIKGVKLAPSHQLSMIELIQ
jgi:5-methylcytosine-specific restriction endonuclease McrA